MTKADQPTRRFYAGVGEVANEYSRLEEDLRDLVVRMVDGRLAYVLTAGENARRLSEVARRLIGYSTNLPDSAVDDLKLIVDAVDSATRHRNYVVHAQWFKMREPGVHLGHRSKYAETRDRPAWFSEELLWTPDDLAALADHIRRVRGLLDAYIDKYFDSPSPVFPSRREAEQRYSDEFARVFDQLPDDSHVEDLATE